MSARPASARHRTPLAWGGVLLAALAGCASATRLAPAGPAAGPPGVAREFRGLWVATVNNLDWPSASGLPVDSQKVELLAILDRALQLRLNAVIFQVRTQADALYESQLEPWSEYLSGAMGRSPGYDPLRFAIDAAHQRGLELHAWFNPFRARTPAVRSPVSPTHISVSQPELVRRYGTHLWMDPGEPAVHQRTIDVVLDVVRRYDVDGIHIDDYFYPYRELDSARTEIPFPDDAAWDRYRAAAGRLSRSDWRRQNVDRFVERLYREVHAVNPSVKVGVSPIGMWRPGYPAEACCFDAWEQIYADARKWFAEGWLDYFVPQLYRPMADTLMNYGVMLGWWAEQNRQGRHLYAGLAPYRVRSARQPDGWPRDEIVGQIYVARGHPGARGHVHFSARSLMAETDSLVQRLERTVYRTPALVPLMPWLRRGPAPAPPRISLVLGESPAEATLAIQPANPAFVRNWVVRARFGGRWQVEVVPGSRREVPLRGAGPLREVAVSAVDRYGQESRLALATPAIGRRPAPRPAGRARDAGNDRPGG